jgi:hypothetical protein
MMEAHDRLYIEQAEFARTIPIPTLGVHTTQFDIDPDVSPARHRADENGEPISADTALGAIEHIVRCSSV